MSNVTVIFPPPEAIAFTVVNATVYVVDAPATAEPAVTVGDTSSFTTIVRPEAEPESITTSPEVRVRRVRLAVS